MSHQVWVGEHTQLSGTPVYRYTGVPIYWCTVLLVCWCAGKLVYSKHSGKHASILWWLSILSYLGAGWNVSRTYSLLLLPPNYRQTFREILVC